MAQCAQSMKATHQHMIDKCSWKSAWPLTGLQDPVDRVKWGGDEVELETILSYNKALEELQKRSAYHPGEHGAPKGSESARIGLMCRPANALPPAALRCCWFVRSLSPLDPAALRGRRPTESVLAVVTIVLQKLLQRSTGEDVHCKAEQESRSFHASSTHTKGF